ncbi:SDR family NAD(P)-dependent oxidoreductase [Jatrophihabitans sp. YIM 134969]
MAAGARPLAVVTGPTSGIGAAFARALAGEGYDLVLVARDVARLDATGAELADRYGISCRSLGADLATDAGTDAVAAVLRDEPVSMLVNNAGFGIYGRFADNDLADELRMLDLDVRSVLVLTHAAVGAMTARGGGDVVNVSSVGGFVPRASGATYVGAKAWVTGFTEALAQQLTGTGVRVCAVCPGYTHTEFHERAQADMTRVPEWMWLEADQVVAEGLADLRRGRPVSVPSLRYKSLLAAVKVLPRTAIRKALGNS